uniref:3-oxo-5-alpha-steroid 4-dehydrogenase C-terminal domain-containing protein n=1 Tax=Rhizophora mucronata TaxID=61149 RepID=A0A2P2JTX7_RHIMU
MEMRLAWLLGAAWVAGTLPILVASLPFSCLNDFHQFLLGFAKRGKIMQPSFNSKFIIPQRFFLHFYVLGVVWTTFLLVLTWHYAYNMAPSGSDSSDYSTIASHLIEGSDMFSLHKSHLPAAKHLYKVWLAVFLLLLMELHVLRRLYETVYVFKYSSSARMHIFGYLTGLFFYTAAPLCLCHFCALDALSFAADQAMQLSTRNQENFPSINFNWQTYVKPITKLRWCYWAGAAVFTWGWLHQYICHAILGSLRENKEKTDEYVIPHGDWFELVSCPHYLAEMVS